MTTPPCQPRWLEAAASLAIEILSFFLSLSNRNERPLLLFSLIFYFSLSLVVHLHRLVFPYMYSPYLIH